MSQPQYDTLAVAVRRALFGRGGFEDAKLLARGLVVAKEWYLDEYARFVDKSYSHRTARLVVEADRTAALPTGYVDWYMVGRQRGSQVVNLLSNPNLVALPESEAAPALGTHTNEQAPTVTTTPVEYAYTGCLEACGVDAVVGVGWPLYQPGEFTVQRAERQLLVSSAVAPGTRLLLHYLCDDQPVGEQTLISPLAMTWVGHHVLSILLEKKEPARAAKYEQRAADARSSYLVQGSGFQLDDVSACMGRAFTRRA